MNEIPQLRRLLSTLDASDEDPPAFADELWEELDAAYDAALARPLDPEPEEIEVIVALEPVAARRRGSRSLAVAAVAAGVVLLALVGASLLRDRGSDRTDLLDTEVDSPEQACARYRGAEPSVADLVAAIAADEVINVEDVRAARDALEQLSEDLEANGGGFGDAVARYAAAAALLSQAEIEVDRGLLAQAERTLANAQQSIEVELSGDKFSERPDVCTVP